MPAAQIYKLALKVLRGVGDPAAGEWFEDRWPTVHVRRRLTETEALITGPVRDIRRTPEAVARAESIGSRLAHAPASIIEHELGTHYGA